MDPRNIPQNPFARPPSETSTRDPRGAPIPPPPYTLQAPVRQPQPTFTNDPFLPRRNDLDGSRQEIHRTVSQSPFSLEKYAAGLPREPPGSATVSAEGTLRDTNGSWSLGDRIMNGYRSQDMKGPGSASSSSPLPPPPPPPPSSFASSIHGASTLRDVIRLRDHQPDSPRMYGAAQEHPPPPPPPFTGRPMLPPSPQYNPPASMSRVPPPPPPFSGGRDLPVLPSANRPGSSMSISSMLDSAPVGRPPREPGTATTLNGASPTGSHSSLAQQQQQPLPTSSPTSFSNGNGFLRRSSPEKPQTSQASTNRPFRAYSGGATHLSYASVKASSPEASRFGPLSATSMPQYSPRSDSGGQHEWRFQHSKNSTVGRIIDRPSSQPNGYSTSPLDIDRKRAVMDAQALGKANQEENALREASLRQANSDGVSSFDFLGRQAQLDRQRELENVEYERQKRLEQEQRSASQSSPREERMSVMNYPFLTQSSVFSEPSITTSRPGKESVIDRLLERSYQPRRSAHNGPLPEESLRQLREERQKQTQQTTKYSPTASRHSFLGNVDERQVQTYPYNTTSAPPGREVRVNNDGTGQQHRPTDDGSQGHRTMLALINDNSKRAGRISPLPQAVQGAQGQKRGPSSDPSIKNEFSRMFAGIGSGVGSAGLNSGASTPFPPPSPKQHSEANQQNAFTGRNDPFEARARNGSRIGKRAKKVKDAAKDAETIDDRVMAGPGGVKRQKHGHHHPLNHRHHHPQRHDEHSGTPSHRAGDTTTPIPRGHLHHHHRVDGTVHYYPCSSKPPTTHHKAPRVPSTIINNESALNLVRDLPRRHLGSTLYSPRLESPASPAAHDTKLPYATAPYTIPRCEGKENCTLTVRIPRFYLSKAEREQVCARRAVWGTDIYSDDSDPLAAAIHAGWIRGEWGDGVDVSMLEINPPNASNELDTKQTVFTTAPASPMLPLPGKDVHLTLLILPTLQKYASRVAHGVRSRAWGDDHDGLSFRVVKMAWVDEKGGRGEERGGGSRRRRLKAAAGSRSVAPPFRLGVYW